MAKKRGPASSGAIDRLIGPVLTGAVLLKVATTTPEQDQQDGTGPAPGSTQHQNGDRGRGADRPGQLPKLAWRDILKRTLAEMKDDGVPLMAAGMAYYGMLALFPALVAVVSIYGILVSPSDVARQVDS